MIKIHKPRRGGRISRNDFSIAPAGLDCLDGFPAVETAVYSRLSLWDETKHRDKLQINHQGGEGDITFILSELDISAQTLLSAVLIDRVIGIIT